MSLAVDIATLPGDPAALRDVIAGLLVDLSTERQARAVAEAGLRDKALEPERLRLQLARLQRMQFGRSSERLREQIAQLELALEELGAEPDAGVDASVAESHRRIHPRPVVAASHCPPTFRDARSSTARPAAPARAAAVCCARLAPT